MDIGFDCDGVIYDFVPAFIEHLRRTGYDTTRCTPATKWAFYEDWGMSLAEFLQHMNDGVDSGVIYTWGEPYPGVVQAMQRLADAGHTIHVITDRSAGSPGIGAISTATWLDAYQVPYHSLTVSADKTIVRSVQFMIEDKVANYEALRAAGVEAYLLDRPYNQTDYECRRVATVDEFVEAVLQRSLTSV